MTKKDYIELAEVLRSTRKEFRSGPYTDLLINGISEKIANVLEKDNPKFDRKMFFSYIKSFCSDSKTGDESHCPCWIEYNTCCWCGGRSET